MSNLGERAWIEPDAPEPDYQAELAAAMEKLNAVKAALSQARALVAEWQTAYYDDNAGKREWINAYKRKVAAALESR